jgi:choline transport protein
MTYAFARDGRLPFSRHLALVHPRLDVPLNSLILTTLLVIVFGLIFLGSTSAFNAIISASVVALGLTCAIPPAINCLRGRRMLPETRAFRLSEPVGWACNLLGIAWTIMTTVLFVFPPVLPVTGSNMNYCVVVFAIILVISLVQWWVDGKQNYMGPRVDESASRNTEVTGLAISRGEGESSGRVSGNGLRTGKGDVKYRTAL